MQRSLLYVESDDHAGNIRGLMSPDVKLPDDDTIIEMLETFEGLSESDILANPQEWKDCFYTPKLRKWQRYLWELRTRNLKTLIEFANGDPIIYLHLGDMTQGQKYVSEWVTTRLGDQFLIALANHRPIMELPNLKLARYTAGTDSHSFGEITSEGTIVDQLKAEYPNVDVEVVSHGIIDLDGFTVDYAHHGPGPGSRKWLEGNIASYYLRDLMIQDLLRGNTPALLVLRAHFHAWAKAYWNVAIDDSDYTSMICLMPSMCGLGAYGRQATKSIDRITNGALLFENVDGKILDVQRLTRTIDLRKREVIR